VLSELKQRKTSFDEVNSVGVVLADGQTWYLPKPWLEVRPTFQSGRAVANYPVNTYGPEIDVLIGSIGEAEHTLAQLVGVATLTAYLLRQNYDLADEDLDRLLCFRVSDPTSMAWTTTAMAVATGQSGPKRSSAGDD
jgi:hypothetical protein